MKTLLDFWIIFIDTIYTSLMELAIRPQVSSEPGLFFAHPDVHQDRVKGWHVTAFI